MTSDTQYPWGRRRPGSLPPSDGNDAKVYNLALHRAKRQVLLLDESRLQLADDIEHQQRTIQAADTMLTRCSDALNDFVDGLSDARSRLDMQTQLARQVGEALDSGDMDRMLACREEVLEARAKRKRRP